MEGRVVSESVNCRKIERKSIDALCKKRICTEHYALMSLMDFQSEYAAGRLRDGVVVGLLCNGTAKAVVNGRNFEMRSGSIFLLNEDSQLSNFKYSKACKGYAVYYSRPFLESINININDFISARMIFRLRPCLMLQHSEVMRLHNIAIPLSGIVNLEADRYAREVAVSLFSALFYTLASVLSEYGVEMAATTKISRSESIFKEFVTLLIERCEQERSVEYYATALDITPKYLSMICRKQADKSALRVIDDAVIRRAKELLLRPDLSVQDVAAKLNFMSQAFFGKYFKQRVGISPSRYKVQER